MHCETPPHPFTRANEAHHVDVVAAPQRGPCFEHQPAGPLISAPDDPSVLPSSSTASTDVPGGQGPASQPGKKPRKSYICEICGKQKQRKPDLDGHQVLLPPGWDTHTMQYPTLQGKQFFFKVSTQAAHEVCS